MELTPEEEELKILQWTNDRFGIPNTFNITLLKDFLLFAQKELGYSKPQKDDREIRGKSYLPGRDFLSPLHGHGSSADWIGR